MDTGIEKASGARSHRLGVWMAAGATLVAVACGGGGSGGVAGVGSGGTGFVTGFGSVIIDGIKYDDTSLDTAGNVRLEDSSTTGTMSDRSVLKIGQRLEVELSDDGSAIRSALVSSEITGPVTTAAAAGSTSFVVAGQTVTVNTDAANGPVTVFEGAMGISDFAVGDRVEVHGSPAADGLSILASRIERKPATATGVKVTGRISQLNADKTQFNIGSLRVTINNSTAVTPAVASLADGQRVKVFAASISSNAVTASAVRIKQFNSDKGDFRLRGVVSTITAGTNDREFVIDGITVDARSIVASEMPAIVVGKSYRVRGRYTAPASPSANGRLVATQVRSSNESEVRDSELKGSITDFVDASNFRVRGVLVNASSATVSPNTCTLGNGQFVEVKGAVPSTVSSGETAVNATTVKCEDAAKNSELKLTGSISALNTTAETFTLSGRVIKYASASYEDGASKASLANGVVVEVEGRTEGADSSTTKAALVARKIELKDRSEGARSNDNRGEEDREVEGRLANDAQATGSAVNFTVSGVQLTCTSASVGSSCSTTALRKGVNVEVRYTGNTAPFTVTRLKIED